MKPLKATAGYSGTPLAKKLGITSGYKVLCIDAPAEYQSLLEPIPDGVTFTSRTGAGVDLAHLFVTERGRLTKELAALRRKLSPRDAGLGIVAEEGVGGAVDRDRGRDPRGGAADRVCEDRVELVCAGLDTLAEITLNGQPLGQTNNMFRAYCWDVKELLVSGTNTLSMIFRSPVAYINTRQKARKLPSLMNAGMAHLRKVQSHFGWDWGPRLPTSGIWREIKLEGYSAARLGEVHIRQTHDLGNVLLRAAIKVDRWSSEELILQLHLLHPNGETQQVETDISEKDNTICLSLDVDSPQLWWPNGLGDHPLYKTQIELIGNGHILDRRQLQLGLRRLIVHRFEE